MGSAAHRVPSLLSFCTTYLHLAPECFQTSLRAGTSFCIRMYQPQINKYLLFVGFVARSRSIIGTTAAFFIGNDLRSASHIGPSQLTAYVLPVSLSASFRSPRRAVSRLQFHKFDSTGRKRLWVHRRPVITYVITVAGRPKE